MARVASGKLRHRVALQAPTISQDATTGEPVTLWETIATPWAEIAPVSGANSSRPVRNNRKSAGV